MGSPVNSASSVQGRVYGAVLPGSELRTGYGTRS